MTSTTTVAMHGEYATAFRQLTGKTPETIDKYNHETKKNKRTWLSKEKQEQLIHTAPVIAPSGGVSSPNSSATNITEHGQVGEAGYQTVVPTGLSSGAGRRVQELNRK